MKKNEVVQLIFETLEPWDNCKMEIKTARDVYKTLENEGLFNTKSNKYEALINVIDQRITVLHKNAKFMDKSWLVSTMDAYSDVLEDIRRLNETTN